MDMLAFLAGWVGTPYLWGGSSHFGTDCSGLAWKFLRAYQVYQGEKLSAQGFFDYYSNKSRWGDYRPGSLAFFGKDAKNIEHVAILVDSERMIEARGGDHTTTSLDIARQRDAVVEITNLKHRQDLVAILRPTYSGEL